MERRKIESLNLNVIVLIAVSVIFVGILHASFASTDSQTINQPQFTTANPVSNLISGSTTGVGVNFNSSSFNVTITAISNTGPTSLLCNIAYSPSVEQTEFTAGNASNGTSSAWLVFAGGKQGYDWNCSLSVSQAQMNSWTNQNVTIRFNTTATITPNGQGNFWVGNFLWSNGGIFLGAQAGNLVANESFWSDGNGMNYYDVVLSNFSTAISTGPLTTFNFDPGVASFGQGIPWAYTNPVDNLAMNQTTSIAGTYGYLNPVYVTNSSCSSLYAGCTLQFGYLGDLFYQTSSDYWSGFGDSGHPFNGPWSIAYNFSSYTPSGIVCINQTTLGDTSANSNRQWTGLSINMTNTTWSAAQSIYANSTTFPFGPNNVTINFTQFYCAQAFNISWPGTVNAIYGPSLDQILMNGYNYSNSIVINTTSYPPTIPQPMTVYGYFTGPSPNSIVNVTAYMDGVLKGVFNVSTSGQYGLFDIQGNYTDYGQTLTLESNNSVSWKSTTIYTPGNTTQVNITS